MKTIWNIPAHPLFVHAPIVLLPLLAIVTIVAALRPGVAKRLGHWLPIASFLVFVSVQLAMQSGEELYNVVVQEKGKALAKHRDLAGTTRVLAFGMLVATVALWFWGRRTAKAAGATNAESPTRRDPVLLGIAAVVIVLSALSTVWLVRTGHEGARIHWKGVIPAGS